MLEVRRDNPGKVALTFGLSKAGMQRGLPWEESKHPRQARGRFGEKPSAGALAQQKQFQFASVGKGPMSKRVKRIAQVCGLFEPMALWGLSDKEIAQAKREAVAADDEVGEMMLDIHRNVRARMSPAQVQDAHNVVRAMVAQAIAKRRPAEAAKKKAVALDGRLLELGITAGDLAPVTVLRTSKVSKAVIRTPMEGGMVAWDKVPVGASIWVTITKPGPLRGRKLQLTKRPDHQFAVTGGTPYVSHKRKFSGEEAERRGAAYKHMTVAPGGRAGYMTAKEREAREEREKVKEAQAGKRKRIRQLGQEKGEAARGAREAFIAATGANPDYLTEQEVENATAALQQQAEDAGYEKTTARQWAKSVMSAVARAQNKADDKRAKAVARLARRVRQRMQDLGEDFEAARDAARQEIEVPSYLDPAMLPPPPTPKPDATEQEIELQVADAVERAVEEATARPVEVAAPAVPVEEAALEGGWVPPPSVYAEEFAEPEHVGIYSEDERRYALVPAGERREVAAGEEAEVPAAVAEAEASEEREEEPASEPVEREIELERTEKLKEKAEAAAVAGMTMREIMGRVRPRRRAKGEEEWHLESEEALGELLDSYTDFQRAALEQRNLRSSLEKLPELEGRPTAALEELTIEAENVSEEELAEAMGRYEAAPPEQRTDRLYQALSDHWNEDLGNTLAGHMDEGASSALTGLVGDFLGRRVSVGRLVRALAPAGAAAALAYDLHERLSEGDYGQVAERIETWNAENQEKTERKVLEINAQLLDEYKLIEQHQEKGLLSAEGAEGLKAENLLRRRRNLGVGLGSLEVSANFLAAMQMAIRGSDQQVTLICGARKADAQERLDALKLKTGKNVQLVNNPATNQWEIRTTALGLQRFINYEEKLKARNGEWEAAKDNEAEVTEADTPPGFKSEVRLRKEQRNDIDWLLKAGGGLVSRVTGAGKTLSAIGFAAHKLAEDPDHKALMVVPKGQVNQWIAEAKKFTDLPVYEVPENITKEARADLYYQGPGVYISSHRDASFDTTAIENGGFGTACVDEPQLLKSRASARLGAKAQRLFKMPFEHRIALTATPAREQAVEAYNIVNWSNPGELGYRTRFERAFGGFGAGTNAQDAGLAKLLRDEIAPYVSSAALTERSYEVDHAHHASGVSEEQKRREGEIEGRREEMIASFRGRGGKREAVKEIARLQRENVDNAEPDTNAKITDFLSEVKASDPLAKHVIFVSGAKQRRTVVAGLADAGYKRTQIKNIAKTSGVKAAQISERKRQWGEDPNCPFIIIDASTSAGHNLQAASHIHILGAPDDAAQMLQAEGRVAREPRVGDVGVHTYKTDSPFEAEKWHVLDDQMKLLNATVPALLAQAGLNKSARALLRFTQRHGAHLRYHPVVNLPVNGYGTRLSFGEGNVSDSS